MSELIRSLIYVGVSLLVLALALLVRFWPSGGDPEGLPKTLFAQFKDPLTAHSLEIARYDDVTGEVNRFRVEQVSGRWVIPSHSNYPADAATQMQSAAANLMRREVLGLATDLVGEHEKFGVLEPNADKLGRGAKGVGVLVSMKDDRGTPLAQLIVGKEVKDQPGVRFVRIPGQSRVLVTRIDLDKLTSDFSVWIEKDLLQLAPENDEPERIEVITFDDYSIDQYVDANTREGFRERNRRMRMSVRRGSDGWQLAELVRFNTKAEPVRVPLAETEELNDASLQELAAALNQLAIVDVRRKPKSLGANLIANQAGLKDDPEAKASLESHGFIMFGNELLSKNGDLVVRTEKGVEYLLRFGELAISQDSAELGKSNRYLMVACHVAEDKFPKPAPPAYPKLPPLPAPAGPAAAAGTAQQPAEKAPPGGDAAQPGEGTSRDAETEPPVDRIRIEAEIIRLKNAYEKELELWRAKRKPADDKVRELNSRFADWYYVIPEEVYAKIHLGRAELISEKANVADEGFGVDAFRRLEQHGLHKHGPEDDHGNAPFPGSGLPPGFGVPPQAAPTR